MNQFEKGESFRALHGREGAILRAAQQIKTRRTFTFADEAVSYQEISAMFEN